MCIVLCVAPLHGVTRVKMHDRMGCDVHTYVCNGPGT